jgi:transposase-like protein
MNKKKVTKKQGQIKLTFNGIPPGEFNLDQLMEEIGLEVQALATSAGVLIMEQIMQSEKASLVGAPYSRTAEHRPWGEQQGFGILNGQKVRVRHPRIRTKAGSEVIVESYKKFQQPNNRIGAVYDQLVHGISCRNYGKVIETMEKSYGISKSVVSRQMVEATSERLKILCERSLADFALTVLLIDGIHVGKTVVIVALGVDAEGKKMMLGMREGATENATVCMELMNDLIDRKLPVNRPILAVLDGSKALRKAVEDVFGSAVAVQRCQIHKIRNIVGELPKKYHAEYTRKLHAAYQMNTFTDAKAALERVHRELMRVNESAARSLEEGMEETLTVHQLELPDILRKSFSSTNLIESAFSSGRTVMRNVKSWQNSNQRQRWVATALLEAEQRFRHVKGHKSMPILLNALVAYTQRQGVDSKIKVA